MRPLFHTERKSSVQIAFFQLADKIFQASIDFLQISQMLLRIDLNAGELARDRKLLCPNCNPALWTRCAASR
jgi:hypothetical protein